MKKISKGLDIPLTGQPDQTKIDLFKSSRVALIAEDFNGMKPTMLVQIGDQVKKGQALFEDKKNPGVLFTSPVAGKILEINRGDKRVFQSIVISNESDEQVTFKNYKNSPISSLNSQDVEALLVESGFWTSFRTRPFSKTPALNSKPTAIFINVMDTQPLALNPEIIIKDKVKEFKAGIEAIAKLTDGSVYVVTQAQSSIDVSGIKNVKHESFSGKHPAGLVGTHIHFLSPVNDKKTVWHLNYQDVIAIGVLFSKGEFYNQRVISLAGPVAKNPRLIKTTLGASLVELTQNESQETSTRVISGSVLGGRTAQGTNAYLGKFHLQVSLIKEGHHREFLGWQSPGLNKFSFKNVFLSKIIPGKKFAMDSNTNGSHRSIVPIGAYEDVMPLDILPTQLLRYLSVKNTDMAINLGALELDEEDLALCTFVDPCKNEFGPILRDNLNLILKEGI